MATLLERHEVNNRSTTLKTRCACAVALAALAISADAFAAHPPAGAHLSGRTVHGRSLVVIEVVSRGRDVVVSVPNAPIYCTALGARTIKFTTPARISANGSFSGTIDYEVMGKSAYKVRVSGRFVTSRLATGTVRSEYPKRACSGTTAFTARSAGGG